MTGGRSQGAGRRIWRSEASCGDHHDIEVVVRRCDQHILFKRLSSEWSLWRIDPPGSGWREWDGSDNSRVAFQLQARSAVGEFDLFLENVEDGIWTFRRDARLTRSADLVIGATNAGIPAVRPEVQLVYMAKSEEAKNQHDFELVRRHLPAADAAWLRNALALTAPGHRWIRALKSQG